MKDFTSPALVVPMVKTSTGLLAYVMRNITDTSFLIGDGTGCGSANAQHFVFESDYRIVILHPTIREYSIITNIDFDQSDYFYKS